MNDGERLEPVPGLFVWRHGRGPKVIVAVHGWSGTHHTFAPLLPLLPPDHTFLAFDTPGSGESAPPKEWTVEALVEPISRALDALGIHRFGVVATCAGAVCALELVRSSPSRVERLVLVEPFAFAPWYFRSLTLPIIGRFFYTMSFANPLGRWITNGALAARRAEGTDMLARFASVDHRSAFAYLRLLCSPPSPARYAGLALPVSIVFGERTFRAVRRSVQIFKAMWIDWARTAELAGAGHFAIEEQPAGVAAVVFA